MLLKHKNKCGRNNIWYKWGIAGNPFQVSFQLAHAL
jgi:hypothetical protein